MNNVFRGINFEILPGNPGAIALFFHGAQGGATQDVSVTSFGGLAGFGGGENPEPEGEENWGGELFAIKSRWARHDRNGVSLQLMLQLTVNRL